MSDLAASTARPPFWRDVRVLQWIYQAAVAAVVFLILFTLYRNFVENSENIGIPTGYGYLDNPAQFPIADSDFRPTQPITDALWVGFVNTLRVSIAGIVLATILGTLIGIGRLSGNWLISTAARVYVEAIRNIPLAVLLTFVFLGLVLEAMPPPADAWEPFGLAVLTVRGVSVPWFDGSTLALLVVLVLAVAATVAVAKWRGAVHARTGDLPRTGLYAIPVFVVVAVVGWLVTGLELSIPEPEGNRVFGGLTMSASMFAILFSLVIYTASHIAEIIRGSIQAVSKGQNEAANALALNGYQRMRYIILPQAFRIALPPLGNQYLNLAKNSTLGGAVAFPELAQVTSISIGTNAPAVPSWLLTLLIFLVLSLVISAIVNFFNRRLALVTR